MSTNAISAVDPSSLSTLVGAVKGPRRHGGGEDLGASGSSDQGITLLASLLQALTQAASAQPSTATTGASATTSTTTTAGSTGTAGTPVTSLVQDLQTFLHDLFRALRHVSRSDDDGGGEHPPRPASTGAASTTAPAGAVTATTSTPVAASNPPVDTGAGAYRPRGIVSALQTLIQDLSNSPAAANTNANSSTALSNLNSAFEKLIADLSGNPATATPTSTTPGSASSTGTGATDGSASSAPADGSSPSTAALQSFLTNFVQDLQNNGAHSLSPLGSSVNTTA
jgi:hypothetical protein